ncbi:MAG: hypothetical protein BKP49_02080 [Treponema sp. CETP13]|nr:MAG: hypothetical protein BKP49_02080 [Treponema sp. CETP13]
MKKIFSAICVCGILTLFFSSCASSDGLIDAAALIASSSGLVDSDLAFQAADAGKKIVKTAEVITPSQEYYTGRAVAGQILSRYTLVRNHTMEAYLNEICMSLVINSPQPEIYNGYHVAIIDSDNLNAFATPGGHILVTSGLINAVDSEEELAAVLAHEISHIQLKHALKAIKSSRATSAVVSTASAVLLAGDNDDLKQLVNGFGDAVDEVVSTMVDSGYSKETEYEADENAVKLLYLAGYNPYAINKMLVQLDRTIGNSTAGFGKTHPTPSSRLEKVKKVEKKLAKNENEFSEVSMTKEQILRFKIATAL